MSLPKRLLHLPKKSKASIQLPRHWEAKSRHRVCCQKIEGAEQKCRKKNAPKISVGSLFWLKCNVYKCQKKTTIKNNDNKLCFCWWCWLNCLVLWWWDMNWKLPGQPVLGCHIGLDSIMRFLPAWNIAGTCGNTPSRLPGPSISWALLTFWRHTMKWRNLNTDSRPVWFFRGGPLCCMSLINGLLLHSKQANKVQNSEVWLCAWTTLHRLRVSGAKCLAQLFRLCVMIGMVFHAALLRSMQVAFAASWRRHGNRRKYMERLNGFTVWSYRKVPS